MKEDTVSGLGYLSYLTPRSSRNSIANDTFLFYFLIYSLLKQFRTLKLDWLLCTVVGRDQVVKDFLELKNK